MAKSTRPETKPVSFRAPTELVAAARRRAERLGLDWAPVMRSLLYDFAIGRNASPSIARECVRIARELLAIGRNLNQIARSLNKDHNELDPNTVAELRTLISKLVTVLKRTHAELLTRRPPRKPWSTPSDRP